MTQTGHKNTLALDKAILVVIDMQAPFVNATFEPRSLTNAVLNLAMGFQKLRLPVLATTQYASRMGDTIMEIRHTLPSGPAHDKMIFDCCGSESFLRALESSQRSQVILCGLESHICVNQTAHGLLARGYQVHAAMDAISARTEMNMRIGLDKMMQAGVVASSVEMALYELLQTATNPHFKDVLSIIK